MVSQLHHIASNAIRPRFRLLASCRRPELASSRLSNDACITWGYASQCPHVHISLAASVIDQPAEESVSLVQSCSIGHIE
jgi:hypothetical protein